jgi:hypothetical protein
MLSPFARTLVSVAACTVASASQSAVAQFLYDPCCRAPRPACATAPACAVAPACAPAPVQTCYQQVPVVEYRDVQRTVQRPEYYTDYEERDVTEYRKVLENQAMQVPTVSYQTVTETRVVQKDCGRWVTNTECRPKVSPCDYDCRPDVFGAMNRTAYAIRMAFTPDQVVRKQWVPNVVTQQIPVTRQVAVRGVKTVNYQTCRVVPVTTRKQVAVPRMRMVAQNVTLREPVTVMKTIAVGSGYALGPTPAAASRTARAETPAANTDLQPSPSADDLGERTAIAPRDTARPGTADPAKTERRKALTDDSEDGIKGASNPAKSRRPALRPRANGSQPALPPDPAEVARQDRPQGVWVAARKPSRVAGEWVARRKPQPAAQPVAQPQGPDLEPIILAQNSPRRN